MTMAETVTGSIFALERGNVLFKGAVGRTSMKKSSQLIAGVLGVTVMLGTGDAMAVTWTSFFTMDALDTTSFVSNAEGYAISGPGDFTGSLSNPAGCTGNLSYAYLSSTEVTSTAARELIARTVLTAYLAGRQIKLRMSSTKCSGGAAGTGGFPVYVAVGIAP